MKVIWSQRAVKSLHIIEDYILQEFGENKRLEFMAEAEKVAKDLEQFPGMGKKEYHSFAISRLSKIIYYEDTKQVVIADVWETRREPKKLTKDL